MSITFNLYQNMMRGGRLNSAYPMGNEPSLLSGCLTIEWDLPTQYTDSSKLFPNTFILRFGTTPGGPYNNVIDMANDEIPGALSRTITGLEIGTTYYAVVQTIDSEGFPSAQSAEVSGVAVPIPEEITYPETYTEIRQADLPYTITSSGNYRIMENLDYDVSLSAGIEIRASDVKVFARADDNIVYTICTNNPSMGIQRFGHLSNIEIFGFHITENGYETTTSSSHGCIFASNLGNSIVNDEIHHMQFTIGQPHANMTGSSTSYGCIVYNSMTGDGVIGKIHNNIFNLRGTKSDSGVRGVSLSTSSPNAKLKVYKNTFNCSDTSGTIRGYIRPTIGVHEAYGNIVNITNCDFTTFGVTGFVNPDYAHSNTFNMTNSNALRGIILEGDKAGSVVMRNHVEVISDNTGTTTNPDVDLRLVRVRFGANDTVVGFNTYNGNGNTKALGIVDLYGDEDADLTRDTYIYHNTVTGTRKGLVNISEQAENTYLWGNTADATNEYGLYLRSGVPGDNANGFYTDGDDINGSIADVFLMVNVGADYPAVENTHFAGLGAINIQKLNSETSTLQGTHYWLDGDAGLITHPYRNTGTKTPNAPANVRVA